jgi:hypothetical protein
MVSSVFDRAQQADASWRPQAFIRSGRLTSNRSSAPSEAPQRK